MAVWTVPFKPIVEALADVESAAGQAVLAASEHEPALEGELGAAIARLATALWELQGVRQRADALMAEVGTPPLHVITS